MTQESYKYIPSHFCFLRPKHPYGVNCVNEQEWVVVRYFSSFSFYLCTMPTFFQSVCWSCWPKLPKAWNCLWIIYIYIAWKTRQRRQELIVISSFSEHRSPAADCDTIIKSQRESCLWGWYVWPKYTWKPEESRSFVEATLTKFSHYKEAQKPTFVVDQMQTHPGSICPLHVSSLWE